MKKQLILIFVLLGTFCIAQQRMFVTLHYVTVNSQDAQAHIDSEKEYFLAKNPKKTKSPSAYNLTTVAYATTPKYIKKSKYIFDGKVSLVKIPNERSIDINEKLDLMFAEYLIKGKK